MLASGPDLRPVGLLTVTHSTGTTAAEGQRVVLAPALPVLMGGRRLGGSPDVRECRLHPLLHGDELYQPDVRVLGKKARAILAKGRRYGTVQMSLPAFLGLEGVEDAKGGFIDPEGVPGLGVRLVGHSVTTPVEEIPDLLLFSRLGFDQGQQTKFKSHVNLLNNSIGIGWLAAVPGV